MHIIITAIVLIGSLGFTGWLLLELYRFLMERTIEGIDDATQRTFLFPWNRRREAERRRRETMARRERLEQRRGSALEPEPANNHAATGEDQPAGHEQAVTVTALRPMGKIRWRDEVIDARILDGGYVDQGCNVDVMDAEGSIVVVRRAAE